MANQMYGYNPNYGGGGGSAVYNTSRPPVTDPNALSDPSLRQLSSSGTTDPSKFSLMDHRGGPPSMYQSDSASRFGAGTNLTVGGVGGFPGSITGGGPRPTTAQMFPQTSWSGYDLAAGMKRQSEAFYQQNVLGNHNTFGQNEAMFSTNALAKRPRVESATNLPVYPQRPGEKDCTHYMLTRTCKFGESCTFDHPIWVPEGGLPDWKEVPLAPSETLPERPGEPDCPYFLKTQKCKFGFRCKFNHPKDTAVSSQNAGDSGETSVLPQRPSEPPCTFYMKTGKCRFGVTCKFHHPKDVEIPAAAPQPEHENGNINAILSEYGVEGVVGTTTIGGGDPNIIKPPPALLYNSKGLPMRQGEADCPFYVKTGSCKYGPTCRYHHPPVVSSALMSSNGSMMMNHHHHHHPAVAAAASNLNFGGAVIHPHLPPPFDPRLAHQQQQLGLGLGLGVGLPPAGGSAIYPQRPGQTECDYYMKTGVCKFGERCKFHHPLDRTAPALNQQQQQKSVVLTLAGLPRREGAIICPFYMKTGTCKYGVQCRFDHPPPGEAIKMAAATTLQGGSVVAEAEAPSEEEEEEEDDVNGGDTTTSQTLQLQQQSF